MLSLRQRDGEGTLTGLVLALELTSTAPLNRTMRIRLADQALVLEATNPVEHLGATLSLLHGPQ